MRSSVTNIYLRARLLLALGLMCAASILAWQFDQAQLRRMQAKSELSETFAGALHTMTDALIALHAVRSASAEAIAGVSKHGLNQVAADLDRALTVIEASAQDEVLAPETRALLETDALDPLGLIDDFAYIAAAISERPEIWGDAAERHVETASSITSQLLPVVRRISAIENEDLDQVLAKYHRWRLMNLGLVGLLAIGIWAFIFRPMEHEIMRVQAEISSRMEQAKAASRAKSEFLATISHEIRTPMNGVLGLAEQLGLTRLNTSQRTMVEELQCSGNALMTIIEDVLDISTIEAGKLKLDPQTVDLRALTGMVLSMFRAEAETRGLSLVVEIDEQVAGAHLVDAGRLRQVLTNLLGNALKFTERGEVRLRVRCDAGQADTQIVTFEVTDTGIGIAAQDLDRIFGSFEQADASTTRRFGGTGLGLSISKRIALALGGDLRVTSTPGRGSTFTLEMSMPVVSQDAAEGPIEDEPMPDIAGIRVLAAEDNRVNRRILQRMLQDAGCDTIFAEDGRTAVQCAAAEDFEIVLMDISMPRMDGYEATQAIRAEAARSGKAMVPVVALTAHVDDGHRARCLAEGMVAVLGKPFRRPEIIRTIAAHAVRHSATRPSDANMETTA